MEALRQKIAEVLKSANYPYVNIRGGRKRAVKKVKAVKKVSGGRYPVSALDLEGGRRRPVRRMKKVLGGRKPAKKPASRKSAPVKSNYKTDRGFQIAKLMHQGHSLGEASKMLSGRGMVRG
jgi:hypothetical protein